jgi:tight adherence protein B
MSPGFTMALAFLGGAMAVAAVYSILTDLFLRDRARVSQRLDEEFQGKASEAMRRSPLFKNLDKLGADPLGQGESATVRSRFANMVEQSGLVLTPARLLLISVISGGVLSILGFLFGPWWLGPILAVLGFPAPILYVLYHKNARLERILAQLPDAFELIARLIRAGQTTSQAFQGVADEFDPPIAAEFGYCYEQQNLGLPPEVALRDMARRIDLVEVKIFVLAVLVQRQTGGNLAELIDNLASIVRERFRIRGKIRVLTAEGRMEASVLLALPPVVFFMIMLLNRNYGQVLLNHPNLLWAMAGLMLVGVLWIRRIINFDF